MNAYPRQTKAAILVEQNKPLVIDHIELPDQLHVGQVLVKIQVSGICGSQLGEISGIKGSDPYLPHLMGHEGFALVEGIGPGVKHVQVGDYVVLHWRKGVGIQSDPPKYLWRGNKVNAGWVTTFNEYAVISENRCTKVPSDTNPDTAALFGCAVTTGFGVVENNSNIKLGESVVVFGAGGIGLNIIQACSLLSAFPIIAVDLFDNRLELAKHLGATHVINTKNIDPVLGIRNALKDDKLDVFIDNTGSTNIIELGYKLICPQGRVVLVGVPRKGSDILIHSLDLHFGKSISGSHGGESHPHIDIPRYMKLIRNGKLSFEKLISSRFSLDNINLAIKSMKDGSTAGRVMIDL